MKTNAIPVAKAQTPAARPTVLIVDDSRLMRVAIKKILKDEFELIEAVDGEDAWAKLEAEPAITCVFSDLSMPNLDGYGLLARVRGSGEGRIQALPFIVITGKEGDLGGLLEEVRSHGATDLVGKPFKSDEIIARTRSLLAAGLPQTVPAAVVAPEAVQQTAVTPVIPTAEAEAEAQRLLEEQEAMRRVAEEARRQAAEEQALREAAEQEARRLREVEEAAQRAAEEARRQAAEEQARREAAEQEARRLRGEQEAARQAAEAARVAAEQAEQERIVVEQTAHQAEEEARICEELRAKARRLAEDQERRRREEAAAALRLGHVPALFVRLALPFMSLANRLLRLGKGEALKQLRKRLP